MPLDEEIIAHPVSNTTQAIKKRGVQTMQTCEMWDVKKAIAILDKLTT
jgi:hypothetical protein